MTSAYAGSVSFVHTSETRSFTTGVRFSLIARDRFCCLRIQSAVKRSQTIMWYPSRFFSPLLTGRRWCIQTYAY